jgi:anti-anti-sigma factor
MDNSICQIETKENVTVLSMVLDEITTVQERALMRDFFTLINEGVKNIVIDLSKTTHIASVGLAALVFMLKRTKKEHCNLVICGVSDKMRSVFKTTGIETLFDVYDNKEEAITRFTKV